MQRGATILNPRLAAAILGLGHGQSIAIADAGLPIPPGVDLLDLALVPGVPGFLETLAAVVTALATEQAIVAAEMEQRSPALYQRMRQVLGDLPVTAVSHAAFKAMVAEARLVVRTGECTPYANIILVGGVTF